MKKPIETFDQLMKGPGWKTILELLRKRSATIMVMESPTVASCYSAIILTHRGFQYEFGRNGMSAAYAGNKSRQSLIKGGAKRVLGKVMDCNEPLGDGQPEPPRPTEKEIVGDILKKIEGLRNKKPVK